MCIRDSVDAGMFGFYLGVNPKQAQDAIQLVLEEIGRFKTERIQLSELNSAKEYTKGSLLLASESADNHMVRNAQNEMHFGGDIALEEIIEKIEAVTADDILELADELIDPDKMTYTLLGPIDEHRSGIKSVLPA